MGNSSNKPIALLSTQQEAERPYSTPEDEYTIPKELGLPTLADLQDVTSSPQSEASASVTLDTDSDDHRNSAGSVNSVSEDEDLPHGVIPEGHFVHTDSINHDLDNTYGPHTRARHITFHNAKLEEKTSDELVKIWKCPERSFKIDSLRKYIIASRIPKFRTSNKIVELSKFLKIDDQYICKASISSLQSFVYSCDDCVDKEMILAVEKNVWQKLTTQQDHIFDLGILDLQLWSCLLCDPDKDDTNIEKTVKASKDRKNYIKNNITKECRTDSSDLFKSMARFHEYFPKSMPGRSHLPLGKNVKRVLEENSSPVEILGLVKDAHFCDTFVHVFSVLKQIHQTQSDKLLKYLKEIFPKLIKSRCDTQKSTLIMLLIKGCLYLLQTIYKHGDIKLGLINNTSTKDLTDLILITLENQRYPTNVKEKLQRMLAFPKDKISQETRNQLLLDEISQLIFHPSVSVRDPIYDIQSQYNSTCLPQRFIHEIERGQANACLHIDSTSVAYLTSQKQNKFRLDTGSFGGDKVLIHTEMVSYDELHRTTYIQEHDLDECQEKQKHINNLNMLRKLRSSKHIVELYAFQIRPLPWYYITEDNMQMTLQRYVLQRRQTKNWICDRQLCTFLMDILGGMRALHSEKVLLRDLTLTNFFIDKGGSVKIGDLSLACEYKKGVPISYMHPGDIPILWTSPEALLDGIYSPQSDVWSLGLVISTLWTHGCEPFTEHHRFPLKEVMRIMLFGERLLPVQWQCIPDAMYTLIKMCMKTDARERIELNLFQCKLQDFMKKLNRPGNYEDWSDTKIEQIQAEDRYYPPISSRQIERLHKPERGIHKFIQDFRKEKDSAYVNLSWDEWKNEVMRKSKGVDARELQATDELKIETIGTKVIVEELMSESSAQRKVPQINRDVFEGRNGTNTTMESDGTAYYKQTSVFEDCNTLLDTARKRLLDDNRRDATNIDPYLRLLLQVAKFLKRAHSSGWISADVRSKSFLVSRSTRENVVYPCRVGRMMNKNIPKTRLYRDSKRWLPPETLIHGAYSESGDVYMWASLVYEILTLYELGDGSTKLDSVPYRIWPEDKLEMVKQKGEFLLQPRNCPGWLYEFLKRCWNPDRTLRPSIETVIEHLSQNIPDVVDERLQSQYRELGEHTPAPCNTPGQRIQKAKGWKSRFNKFGKSVIRLLGRRSLRKRSRRQQSTIMPEDRVHEVYGALNPACNYDSDDYTSLKRIWSTVGTQYCNQFIGRDSVPSQRVRYQTVGDQSNRSRSSRTVRGQSFGDQIIKSQSVRGKNVSGQRLIVGGQSLKLRVHPGRRGNKRIRDRAESRRKKKNNDSSSSSDNFSLRHRCKRSKRKAHDVTSVVPPGAQAKSTAHHEESGAIHDDQTRVKKTPKDDITFQMNGLHGTSNSNETSINAPAVLSPPLVLIDTQESYEKRFNDLPNAVPEEPLPDYPKSANDSSGDVITRGHEADTTDTTNIYLHPVPENMVQLPTSGTDIASTNSGHETY